MASSPKAVLGTEILTITDDHRSLFPKHAPHTPQYTLANPESYQSIKTLVINDPNALDHSGIAASLCLLGAQHLDCLLRACPDLERFVWKSSFSPPDGLCEIISKRNARLSHFEFCPPAVSCRTTKWDAPSLPLLASLPSLSSLHISRLSQAGAGALSELLSVIESMNDENVTVLESLSVDIVWLDDSLCEKIVGAGRRIRKLIIGTQGTKLTDSSIVSIAENMPNLAALTLSAVEGRLSRSLWEKCPFSPSFESLRISLDETPNHSWTADHLSSLHALMSGFASLATLSLIRVEDDSVPSSLTEDDSPAMPVELVNSLKTAKALKTLECDWYSWTIADVKAVCGNCLLLEDWKLCLSVPFSKLLSSSASFSALSRLRTLSVRVNPSQAPGAHPVQFKAKEGGSVLPTPNASPILGHQRLLFTSDDAKDGKVNDDPSMPLLRDVKRLVKKLPALEVLEWYGRYGRGSWIVSRGEAGSVSNTKGAGKESVEYRPPSISYQAPIQVIPVDDVERKGQIWTGLLADEHREKNAKDAERAAAKDMAKLSISTNGSTNDNSKESPQMPPTPTESTYSSSSRSPAQVYTQIGGNGLAAIKEKGKDNGGRRGHARAASVSKPQSQQTKVQDQTVGSPIHTRQSNTGGRGGGRRSSGASGRGGKRSVETGEESKSPSISGRRGGGGRSAKRAV